MAEHPKTDQYDVHAIGVEGIATEFSIPVDPTASHMLLARQLPHPLHSRARVCYPRGVSGAPTALLLNTPSPEAFACLAAWQTLQRVATLSASSLR